MWQKKEKRKKSKIEYDVKKAIRRQKSMGVCKKEGRCDA